MARLRYLGGWALIWLVCAAVAAATLAQMAVSIARGGKRAWNLAIGYDQLGNAALGGSVDEMVSARAWRQRDSRVWGRVRRLVDWSALHAAGEAGHCQSAYQSERLRAQLPKEYRTG